MSDREGLRVAVCGNRSYRDRLFVYQCLDRLRQRSGISLIIHGDEAGPAHFARDWAREAGIPEAGFQADVSVLGGSADETRNQRILLEGAPNAAIAFPGGDAETMAIIRYLQRAGIKLWTPERPRHLLERTVMGADAQEYDMAV
jgi:hypothetical protein